MSVSQGFPKISVPLVDKNGVVTGDWYQFLVSLWTRTGSSAGTTAISTEDSSLIAALAGIGQQSTALLASRSAAKALSVANTASATATSAQSTATTALSNAATALATANAAVPESAFRTASFYGTLVGDNATDNKTVLDLIMAGGDPEVRLPLGGASTFYTTDPASALVKRMTGRSKFRTSGGDALPADWRYIGTRPAKGTGADVFFDFSGDLTWCDALYGVTKKVARRSNSEIYFDSTVTPRWMRWQNEAGGSGSDAEITVGGGPGTTSITVDCSYAGSLDFAVNDAIAIRQYFDGPILLQTTIDSITGSGASTVLHLHDPIPLGVTIPTPTFPVGSITQVAVVTKCGRTNALINFGQMIHLGWGDGWIHQARMVLGGGSNRTGQRRPEQNKSGGLFGGDMVAGEANVYGQCFETMIGDGSPDNGVTPGFDMTGLGYVCSLVRTNDTASQGKTWGQLQLASGGTKAVDFGVNLSGPYRTGLNTVRADFSSFGQAAIQLGAQQRIYLDGDIDAAGRGADPQGMFALVWGNKQGTTFFSALPSGGLDARGQRTEFITSNNTSVAGYGSFNIRGTVVEAHRPLALYDTNGVLTHNLDPGSKAVYLGSNSNVGMLRFVNDFVINVDGAARIVAHTTGGGGVVIHDALTVDNGLTAASAAITGAISGASLSLTGTGSAAAFTATGALTGGSLNIGAGTATTGIHNASGAITSTGAVQGSSLITQSGTGGRQHFVYFGDQALGLTCLVIDTTSTIHQAAIYVNGIQKVSWV